ncbi:unnamed protein product [Hymenolepis diminuta]|uniref:Uncharacterized protein n=1 Tax=Hymenolepis diminuta TaxID=6216 RepID=A0A564ZE40_HYMDI|nr:unnamed protein product [Hymenolepis diminuta]
MLWRDLAQVTHIKLSLFSRQQRTLVSVDSYTSCSSPLFPSTLLSLPLLLFVVPLNTFWSTQLLVFCFTIVVSSCSNSYELVTVIVVVIC